MDTYMQQIEKQLGNIVLMHSVEDIFSLGGGT